MSRSLLGALVGLLVVAAAIFLLVRSDAPGGAGLTDGSSEPAMERPAPPAVAPAVPAPAAADRLAVTTDEPPASYRAALCGITGRVVDSHITPLPDLGVELMGGNLFTLLPAEEAWLGQEPPDLSFVLGKTETDTAGRFRFDGIDPHGFHLLAIDIGGPRATYRPVDATPNPGEIVDLGDIVLAPCVTLVGRVVDEDRAPVAGARVRVTDLPPEPFQFGLGDVVPGAAVAGTIPGTDGWIVVPVPPIATSLIARIPYHQTVTAADGTFRLEGVPIGRVMVLVDHAGLVPLVSGPVATGEEGERQLPELRLLFGDELVGRVVNDADEPVAGAQVLAGAQVPFLPAALLLPVGETDADGVFRVPGLPDRAHVVAARAWDATRFRVEAGVFPGLDEPVIRLQDTYALRVTARDRHGEVVRHPRVSIQQADVVVDIMLVVPPLPLAGRVEPQEDGSVLVRGLSPGKYHVFARAPGFAVGKQDAEVGKKSTAVEVVLEPEVTGSVQVVARGDGRPVEYALVMVYAAQGDDENPLDFVPRITRRTDRHGVALLAGLEEGTQRIRVFHPAYAMADAWLTSPGPPILVELSAGGTLHGTVYRDGVPVTEPHWVLTLPQGEELTPLLRLARTDAAGGYRISHLRPGEYGVGASERFNLDGSESPGFSIDIKSSSTGDGSGETEVSTKAASAFGTQRQALIVEGRETRLDLDLMRIEGNFPKARLLGRVYLNGAPRSGLLVVARADIAGRAERSARTNAAGVFDVGEVPAGELDVRVFRGAEDESGALAIRTVRAEPNDVVDLEFLIETGRVTGRVLAASDSSPVPFASVDLLKGGAEEDGDRAVLGTVTLEDGTFILDVVPAGSYLVMADKPGFARASEGPVQVPARGAPPPLTFRLLSAVSVSGTVRLPPEAGPAPYLFLYFDGHDDDGLGAFSLVEPGGTSFRVDGVAPGTYDVRLYGAGRDLEVKDLEVPPSGLSGVVLYPEVVAEDE